MKKRKNLGPALPDEIARITAKTGHFQKGDSPEWTDTLMPHFRPDREGLVVKNSWRIIAFAGFTMIAFFLIFLRLFHLQIVKGQENRDLADGNRIQVKIIHAPRGVIYDRNGKILASNSPAFRLNDSSGSKYKARLIQREEAMEWEVNNNPKFADLEVDNVRNYPFREQLAHTLGFMGEISDVKLQKEDFKNYKAGDQIGLSGIEARYEKILRGADGGEIIEVDSKGRKIRTLRHEPAIPGRNLYLSIDVTLQEKLYQAMKETLDKSGLCCGAFVAEDPQNGQILALGSFPSFDPNIFGSNNDSVISEIFSHKDAPVLNRAIGGTYPPGSTFKIISSLAALSSGKITADTAFEDTGVMYLGPYQFSNWYFNQYGKLEGQVNLLKALQRSNDIYFYKIAQIIGENALAEWSEKLFLGRQLGIDIPGEEEGLVPDNEWKNKALKAPWYPGDTLHMSIGQGFMLTTPLQVLGFTSYIASGGDLYKPQLILSDKPKLLISNLLPKDKINFIKKGLELVTREGGTAWPFFAFPVPTAGKTGTAEYGDPKGRTHAWYTAYAPADKSTIAITVLVEGGGEGSSVAAPIAKEGLRFYFSPDKNKLIPDVQ